MDRKLCAKMLCSGCNIKLDTSTDAYYSVHLQHQLEAEAESKTNVAEEYHQDEHKKSNEERTTNGNIPLMVACSLGFRGCVLEIISKGADIELRDERGYTALIIACLNSHKEVVQLLIEKGAQIEGTCKKHKETPLCVCCSKGRLEIAEYLIQKGANKEHRNISDYTPLCLAAKSGHEDLTRLLVKHGADLNCRAGPSLGITPLMIASLNGHVSVVRALVDAGAYVHAYLKTNHNTALSFACFLGWIEIVKILVQHRAKINHSSKAGLTPLMEAACGNCVDIGLYLIENGAEVNLSMSSTSRDTALTIAAVRGHDRFVRMLLANNAVIDKKNKRLQTPLWLACSGGYLETVKCLVEHGADPHAEDTEKVSCLNAAFKNGQIDVVSFLVEKVKRFPTVQYMNSYLKRQPLINKKTISCKNGTPFVGGDKQQTAHTDSKKSKDDFLKCIEIIVAAKEAQVRVAEQNARELICSLEEEEKKKQAKKDAIAKKREKRRQKRSRKKNASIERAATNVDAALTPPVQSLVLNQQRSENPEAASKGEEEKKPFSEPDNDDGDDSVEKGAWIAVGVGRSGHHKKQKAEPILKLAPPEPKPLILYQPAQNTANLRPSTNHSQTQLAEIVGSCEKLSANRTVPVINDTTLPSDLRAVKFKERVFRPSRATSSTWLRSTLPWSKSETTASRPSSVKMAYHTFPKAAKSTIKLPLPEPKTQPIPAPAAPTVPLPTHTKAPVSITNVGTHPRNKEPLEEVLVLKPVPISDLAFAGPVLSEKDRAKAPGYERECKRRRQQSLAAYLAANSQNQQRAMPENVGFLPAPAYRYHHPCHYQDYHYVPNRRPPQARFSPRFARPAAPRFHNAPSASATNEPGYLQYIRCSPRFARPAAPRFHNAPSANATNEPGYLQYIRCSPRFARPAAPRFHNAPSANATNEPGYLQYIRCSPRFARPAAPRFHNAPSANATNEPGYLQYIRCLLRECLKSDSNLMMVVAVAVAAAVDTSVAYDSSARNGVKRTSYIVDELNDIFRRTNFSRLSRSSLASRIEEFFSRDCFYNLEPNIQVTAAAAAAAGVAAYSTLMKTTSATVAPTAGMA